MMRAASALPGARPVDEGLVDVGLHDRELHARLVAQQLDVRGRAGGGQDLEVDVRRGADQLREIVADRVVGAALAR